MTKQELMKALSERLPEFEGCDLAYAVHLVFDSMSKSMKDGDRIEIRNFGVFEVKTRAARMGRNPKTGKAVSIPPRRVIAFKPGKKLKEMVGFQ
ncbi:MAG: integration host factor subunit beta [Syntrophales bacterium]|nr:integration host factor subunit beta [Syntrophales bacterium]